MSIAISLKVSCTALTGAFICSPWHFLADGIRRIQAKEPLRETPITKLRERQLPTCRQALFQMYHSIQEGLFIVGKFLYLRVDLSQLLFEGRNPHLVG